MSAVTYGPQEGVHGGQVVGVTSGDDDYPVLSKEDDLPRPAAAHLLDDDVGAGGGEPGHGGQQDGQHTDEGGHPARLARLQVGAELDEAGQEEGAQGHRRVLDGQEGPGGRDPPAAVDPPTQGGPEHDDAGGDDEAVGGGEAEGGGLQLQHVAAPGEPPHVVTPGGETVGAVDPPRHVLLGVIFLGLGAGDSFFLLLLHKVVFCPAGHRLAHS